MNATSLNLVVAQNAPVSKILFLNNGNQDNPKAISYPMGRYLLKVIINSSYATDLLRCPLKTSESPGFSTEGVYLTVYFTKVMNFETFL